MKTNKEHILTKYIETPEYSDEKPPYPLAYFVRDYHHGIDCHNFTSVHLISRRLDGFNFSNIDFSKANFRYCSVINSKFDQAILDSVIFERVRVLTILQLLAAKSILNIKVGEENSTILNDAKQLRTDDLDPTEAREIIINHNNSLRSQIEGEKQNKRKILDFTQKIKELSVNKAGNEDMGSSAGSQIQENTRELTIVESMTQKRNTFVFGFGALSDQHVKDLVAPIMHENRNYPCSPTSPKAVCELKNRRRSDDDFKNNESSFDNTIKIKEDNVQQDTFLFLGPNDHPSEVNTMRK